jgi:hypothetical protein
MNFRRERRKAVTCSDYKQMLMKVPVLAAAALLLFVGNSCNVPESNEDHLHQSFYELVSDWDILYVPVIEPYRVSSIDKGETWLLSHDTPEIFPVISVGVTNNYVYGQAADQSWFLSDTRSSLQATYQSQNELAAALRYLQLPVHEIRSCGDWWKQLSKGKPCYWHPPKGKAYPVYPALSAGESVVLHISGDVRNPEFTVSQQIQSNDHGIYFFRVESGLDNNKLLYLSFDGSAPVLVTNNEVIPVYANNKYLEIVLYVPFPVAEDRKVPENERVRIFRNVELLPEK